MLSMQEDMRDCPSVQSEKQKEVEQKYVDSVSSSFELKFEEPMSTFS